MKVLLLNGSRRSIGCTRTALDIVASELDAAGIETVFIFPEQGSRPKTNLSDNNRF